MTEKERIRTAKEERPVIAAERYNPKETNSSDSAFSPYLSSARYCHRNDAEIQQKIDRGVWRPSLDTGHIYSTEKHGNLIETITNAGYAVVGRKKDKLVSRVIWIAAHGLPELGMEVDHINGNKTDNRLENLQLVTAAENRMRSHAVLTFAEAQTIKQSHAEGKTVTNLAAEYGVSGGTIRRIIHGKTYRTQPPHERNAIQAYYEIEALNPSDLAKIREEHRRGASYRQIANRWGLTVTTVKKSSAEVPRHDNAARLVHTPGLPRNHLRQPPMPDHLRLRACRMAL